MYGDRAPGLVDVRSTEDLVDALSQVFLFVEHVNALSSLRRGWALGKEGGQRRFPKSIGNLLLWLRDRMSRPSASWLYGSDILRLSHEVGVAPTPSPGIMEAVTRLLLRPAKVGPDARGLNWEIDVVRPLYLPNPSTLESTERFSERVYFYGTLRESLFANKALKGREPVGGQSLSTYYWDEPFDPVNVVRLFLSEILGEQGRSADQYLQRWICTQFGLIYDKATKYALAGICRRFNLLFYDVAIPSTHIIHTRRAAKLSTELLVMEFADLLAESHGCKSEPVSYKRQALGLYLMLRFCRQIRCGYCWFEYKDSLQRREAATDGSELDRGRQFISALRPLGYTYLQSRAFGMISSVPGLSNIFRGGLLPRTSTGRTLALIGPAGVGKTVLALQMLTDIAGSGGLAVYFSFEESYDAIIDRLVTFGLFDTEKFQIVQAGGDFGEVLRKTLASNPRKGVLVLYSDREEAPFPIADAIEAIGSAARGKVSRLALVLDSVNALDFGNGETLRRAASDRRGELSALISGIEKGNFWGLLIAEKDDQSFRTLPYLIDTAIELGIDEATHLRWIEIKKCRVQDYHPGRHPFRMTDSMGITIYPSLASRRSSLRGRVRSTASEQRFIPFPEEWRSQLLLEGIREKSSTLIWGPPGGGKTLLMLNLLTEHTWRRAEESERLLGKARFDLGAPSNVLVVTFRTPEKGFLQNLERYQALFGRWQRIKKVILRWCSVGVNFGSEQLISEIRRHFNASRREGLPIERVVFDETESAEDFLPALRGEPLFWPTLFELTSTEATNSFFVCSNSGIEPPIMRLLKSSMDYVFHAYETSAASSATRTAAHASAQRWVAVDKHPELVPGENQMVVPLRVGSKKKHEGLIY